MGGCQSPAAYSTCNLKLLPLVLVIGSWLHQAHGLALSSGSVILQSSLHSVAMPTAPWRRTRSVAQALDNLSRERKGGVRMSNSLVTGDKAPKKRRKINVGGNDEGAEIQTAAPGGNVEGNKGMELVMRIRNALQAQANPAIAAAQSKYLRNQFAFFGLMTPDRRAIFKDVLRDDFAPKKLQPQDIRTAATLAYDMKERECHYFAVELCQARPDAIDLVFAKSLIMRHSWWDTVDSIASNVVGPLVLLNRESGTQEMRTWLKSDHMWVRRTSVLHQLNYKEKTDVGFLTEACEALASEEEFFIRKSVGWALRQYARTDGATVSAFCNRLGDKLSYLSRKEALKHQGNGRNFKIIEGGEETGKKKKKKSV